MNQITDRLQHVITLWRRLGLWCVINSLYPQVTAELGQDDVLNAARQSGMGGGRKLLQQLGERFERWGPSHTASTHSNSVKFPTLAAPLRVSTSCCTTRLCQFWPDILSKDLYEAETREVAPFAELRSQNQPHFYLSACPHPNAHVVNIQSNR